MRISLNWINQYVDIRHIDPHEIAKRLTFAGIEVEAVEPLAVGTNLVTAHVLDAKKMDGSDHLTVCQVDMGPHFGTAQIVCGAPNIGQGQKVIVARPGAALAEVKIAKTSIRGHESMGMICSLLELGVDSKYLNEDQIAGIEVLPQDTPIGREDVLGYLGLADTVLSLKLLANRPDAMALYNVAKEIALLFDLPLKDWKRPLPKGKTSDFKVKVTTDKCPQFTIRTVEGIGQGETPIYIKQSLQAMGMRPISPLVDIGNYVMLLTVQPLHIYDLDLLKTKELKIHDDYVGTFTALDEKDYALEEGDIAITSGATFACLAGIMGSQTTAVGPNTKNIAIEAANFEGAAIRYATTRLNLLSEASQRFIKGINPHQTDDVLDFTINLIRDVLGFKAYSASVAHDRVDHQPKHIPFTYEAINRRLGTSFSATVIRETLERVGFAVSEGKDKATAVVPPARIDVEGVADLSEEVIRIQGFEHLDVRLPSLTSLHAGLSLAQRRFETVRQLLRNRGLDEVLTYTLLNKEEAGLWRFLNHEPLFKLTNPMTQDHEYVRGGLAYSLLQAANYNVTRQNKQLALFEISPIETSKSKANHLGLVLVGQQSVRQQLVTKRYDFYDAKGLFEAVMAVLGIDGGRYRYERLSDRSELHPGQSATIHVDNKQAGFIGTLSPAGVQQFDFKKLDVVVMEIDLGYILNLKVNPPKMAPLSKYPTVMRDLAVIVDAAIEAGTIVKAIRKVQKDLIRNVEIFDVYMGTGIPEGKKSLALTIHLNDEKKTLTDLESTEVIEKVKVALANSFNASFRI